MNVNQFIDGRAQQIYFNNTETFFALGKYRRELALGKEIFCWGCKQKRKRESISKLAASYNVL